MICGLVLFYIIELPAVLLQVHMQAIFFQCSIFGITPHLQGWTEGISEYQSSF